MLLPTAVLYVVSCALVVESATDSKGFIFTAPRVLTQDANNEFHLSLFGFEAAGEVTIRLLKSENDTVFTEQTIPIEKGTSNKVISFFVPPVGTNEARLQIDGEFETEEPYKIFGEDTVKFRSSSKNVIFIQTDKPIYKTSQEVKIRVLALNSRLRPFGEQTIGNVWIEDPSGYRMVQWKNVSLGKGIIQKQFPLSNEPPLGAWKIVASINGSEEYTTFEVKEYVLPKYDLTIKTPPFVLVDAEKIPIEVCAKYTYGKSVQGDLNMTIGFEGYSWAVDKLPIIEVEEKLNGCFEYTIDVEKIDPHHPHMYRQRIQIFASVTEKGTGTVSNQTKFIDRTSSPLNLNFDFGHRQYIKPGLPFQGTVKVTNPDDTPAADELVSICAEVSRKGTLSTTKESTHHCSNFTSDAEGMIPFTLLPQSADMISLSLEAKSLKYTYNQPKDGNKPTLDQPRTTSNLRPWYSPSGTHLQVQSFAQSLPCEQKTKIQVLYTANKKTDFRLYYTILSRGKIFEQKFIDVTFNEEDTLNEYNNTRDQQIIQIFPKADPTSSEQGGESEEDDNKCKAIKEYVPYVGCASIEVDITSHLSPWFHIIVYYNREDREIIADSHKFKVEKCFDNKVKFSFGDEVKQPGAETVMTVSASPKSICGIKIVDKSVTLLDSSEQLTKEKVYGAIERLNGGQFDPKNHCNDKKPQPGRERKAERVSDLPSRPSPGWYSSSFEDTLTAYESAGLIVVTDFSAFTRPCEKDERHFAYYGDGIRPEAHILLRAPVRPPPARPLAPHLRPVAILPLAAKPSPPLKKESTESLVDVRDFFPETWLFELETIEDGTLVRTETLPHTITEWVGSAVCIIDEDGLGLSDKATIKGFQEFFMSFSLPYSVIRSEKLPLIVTAFSYISKCLPITFELEESEKFALMSESAKVDICLCSGESETYKYMIQPKEIGTLNLTVTGRTADSNICGEKETSDAVARDTVKNPIIVEAEGFPVTEATNYLFCPQDSEDDTYEQAISFVLPDDVVEGSERAYISVTGDIMGPSIENLDRLVQLPTGCGEQNMVKLAPIVDILNYLSAINRLPNQLEQKAKDFILQGYQRQLQYRHDDGSFSAFGKNDDVGSIWLTAFTLRSLSEANKYVSIDSKTLEEASKWIISKQQEDGCFPTVGRVLHSEMMGGVTNSNSSGPLTAYLLSSLIVSGIQNDTLVSKALSCIEKEDKPSSYHLSLYAYAAALAENKDKATEYLNMLNSRANSTGGVIYFPSKEGGKSIEIETAGYAILAYLELDQPIEKSLPIVRWLTQKRNYNGGFSSTQDTVVGLKALAEFATQLGLDPVDLNIAMTGSLTVNGRITEDDRLIVHKYKVPSVPLDNAVKATGTGCGLLQATFLYNKKHPTKRDFFTLNVKTSPDPQDECRYSTIAVCSSFLPEGKKSNMAIISLKMISGYSPLEESFESVKRNKELGLKRVEFEENTASFYFDELDNSGKCFEFTVEKVLAVEDTKPGTATVFDYYAPERSDETFYEIEQCQ